MNKTVRAISIAIGLATASAAAGYLLAGLWPGLLLALLWGALWVFGILRQIRSKVEDNPADPRQPKNLEVSNSASSTALLGYVLLVIGGVWAGVWPGWLLLGLVAALAGWDLEYLANRLRYMRADDMAAALTNTHLRRLGRVLAASLLLGGTALILHYQLNFGLAVLIALLAVFGLTRFVNLFKQTRNQ